MDGRDDSGPFLTGMELWYIVPVAFIVLVLAVGGIAVSALNSSEASSGADAAALAKLPPYWTVKKDQTYSDIAAETGLSIDQLVDFNPHVNPETIVPGQKIQLREDVPAPPRAPLGPKYWKVERGQSFGSIAAKTGKPIDTLIALNRKLKPDALQPGDRVRLRR